jgi:hypothetical protein
MLNVTGEYTFREMADMQIIFGRTYGDEHAAAFFSFILFLFAKFHTKNFYHSSIR